MALEDLLRTMSREAAQQIVEPRMAKAMEVINNSLEQRYSASQPEIMAAMQAHREDPEVQALVRGVQMLLLGEDQCVSWGVAGPTAGPRQAAWPRQAAGGRRQAAGWPSTALRAPTR